MNCYHLYKTLKHYFPDAIPYHDSNHVITKIGDKFFDKNGEAEQGEMTPLIGVEFQWYERDLG